jgi:hypothetical protein
MDCRVLTDGVIPFARELLAPDILVLKSDFQSPDPTVLPNAVIAFCTWCVDELGLPHDTVQPDAWLIYHTDFYVGQVRNGGHGQFAGNSRMDRAVLVAVDAGLEALGLDDLGAIFGRFVSVMATDRALYNQAVDGCGFGDIPAAIKALDDAFFASHDADQFNQRTSDWLRRIPHVLALTPAEKRAREKKIVARTVVTSGPLARLVTKTRDFWSGYSDPHPIITTREDLAAAAARLGTAFQVAMTQNDEKRVDAVIAEYRAVRDACPPDDRQRWSAQLLHLESKLLLAGQRWGRTDLLGQAVAVIRHSIAEDGDEAQDHNAAYRWRALGEALVSIAQINSARISAMPEALAAFDRSIAIDEARAPGQIEGIAGENWVGKAEAVILLASEGEARARLSIATALLDEAPALQTMSGPARKAAAYADLLMVSPSENITDDAKWRTRCLLDAAIACERENDGAIWSSPFRLKRLLYLRAHPHLASARDASTSDIT